MHNSSHSPCLLVLSSPPLLPLPSTPSSMRVSCFGRVPKKHTHNTKHPIHIIKCVRYIIIIIIICILLCCLAHIMITYYFLSDFVIYKIVICWIYAGFYNIYASYKTFSNGLLPAFASSFFVEMRARASPHTHTVSTTSNSAGRSHIKSIAKC